MITIAVSDKGKIARDTYHPDMRVRAVHLVSYE